MKSTKAKHMHLGSKARKLGSSNYIIVQPENPAQRSSKLDGAGLFGTSFNAEPEILRVARLQKQDQKKTAERHNQED